MATELYLLFGAAHQFLELDEKSAASVLRSVEGLNTSDVPIGESGVPGHRALVRSKRIEGSRLSVQALIEPDEHVVTVLAIGTDTSQKAFCDVARQVSLSSCRSRPAVGGVKLGLSASEIQGSVRTLLSEYQKLIGELAFIPGRKEVADRGVTSRVFGMAKRWKTTDARAEFRTVMDFAASEPQVVERDGREVLIIERELLKSFEAPLTGAEIADRFAKNRLASLTFREDLKRRPPPAIHALEGR